MQNTGTIYLLTQSQAALFEHELTGQISDGMWENSGPRDHWKFWSGLQVVVDPTGEPRVKTPHPWMCKKDSYAFNRLYAVVGDRMLALGRMARAASFDPTAANVPFYILGDAATYMPPTLDEWRDCKAGRLLWKYDFVAGYMESVTDSLAAAFYATSYDMRDLRADVKVIQRAMKNRSSSSD